MATLLEHSEEIRAKLKAVLADKVVTLEEAFSLAGIVVEAAKSTYLKIRDKTQFAQLVAEAEELYDTYADPANYDIPRVPEFMERAAFSAARPMIRMALEGMVDSLNDLIDKVE